MEHEGALFLVIPPSYFFLLDLSSTLTSLLSIVVYCWWFFFLWINLLLLSFYYTHIKNLFLTYLNICCFYFVTSCLAMLHILSLKLGILLRSWGRNGSSAFKIGTILIRLFFRLLLFEFKCDEAAVRGLYIILYLFIGVWISDIATAAIFWGRIF